MFVESLKSPTTLTTTASAGTRALNTIEEDEKKSCCTVRNVVGPIFKILNAFGAFGTAVAAIVALVYYVKNSCDQPIAPFVASVVVSVVAAFFAVLNEAWDIFINYDDKKKTEKKEKIKEEHQEKRFNDLEMLVMKTLTTVENYQENPKPENFRECVNTIKEIPVDPNNNRDKLLSRVIQMSNNEDNLKITLGSIDQLGSKIDNNKKDNSLDGSPRKRNPGKNGESQAASMGASADMSLMADLDSFQKEWKRIEEIVGFKPNVLMINGVLYDCKGNKVGSPSDTLSPLSGKNIEEI